MGIDYKDLNNLVKRTTAAPEVILKTQEQVVKETGLRFLSMVKKDTPVKSGYLRRGWKASPVKRKGLDCYMEVNNPVEYASYVEFGHRTPRGTGWVPGQFFATRNLELCEAHMQGLWSKRLMENALNKVF